MECRSKGSEILRNQCLEQPPAAPECCRRPRKSELVQAQCAPRKLGTPQGLLMSRIPRCSPWCSHRWFGIQPQDLSETPKPPLLESHPRPRSLSSSTCELCA